MAVLTIFSLLVGIAGLVGTIYFGIKSAKLERKVKRYSWHDVEHGVDFIRKQSFQNFLPDLIITVSIPGRIVADLLAIRSMDITPHYAGIPIKKDGSFPLEMRSNERILKTSKYTVVLPNDIFKDTGKKLLILDSAVVTGDTLQNLISILIDNGFKKENIKSATLIATDLAIKSQKGPDYFCYSVPDTNYYLPWGNFTVAWY